MTALMALRIGAAKFIIPFAFAYYPTLLLVQDFDTVSFISIVCRLTLVIYLVSSALSAFDRERIGFISIILRLVIATLCLISMPLIHIPAAALGIILILFSWKIYPFNKYRKDTG